MTEPTDWPQLVLDCIAWGAVLLVIGGIAGLIVEAWEQLSGSDRG